MTDIAELFSRDPLSYSDADLDLIISEMRKSRAAFNLGNMTAGKTKPKTEKQKTVESMLKGLDIEI